VTLKDGTVAKALYLIQHGQERTGMATTSSSPGPSLASCSTLVADGIAGAPFPAVGGRAYRTGPAGVSALCGGSPTDSIVTVLEPSLAILANR